MLQVEWTRHRTTNSKWPWPPSTYAHMLSHKHMHEHLNLLTPCMHRYKTSFSLEHTFDSFVFTDFCLLCSVPVLSSGLLSGGGSEGCREVGESGNSLLIPTELAFRFAAGLLRNRHHRSRPANQKGTQALMRADALSRCGWMVQGHLESAEQGRQYQWRCGGGHFRLKVDLWMKLV